MLNKFLYHTKAIVVLSQFNKVIKNFLKDKGSLLFFEARENLLDNMSTLAVFRQFYNIPYQSFLNEVLLLR
jgi:hypothetical protein